MSLKRRKAWLLEGSVAVTGAFISAREMARLLQGEMDFTLVLPRGSKIAESELHDFVDVYRLPIRPLRKNFLDVFLYFPYLLLVAVQLRILMWRDKADVLFVNDFYLVQGALLRFLGYKGEILTWVRIDPAAFGHVAKVWLWFAALASRSVIAVSRYIQRVLPDYVQSSLLYDPVSAEFLPAPATADNDDSCFVFLGNYIHGKGQDVALEAMSEVLKTCPDARLEFYGGDMGLEKNREYRRSLERRAEELGLLSSVYFGEAVPSPRTVLLGKRAALNLSRSESFSRTVLEASACGLPVIATRCGGPEEILENGRTGFLIHIGDFAQCADKMSALCKKPDLAKQMGLAGRARVMSTFGVDVFKSEIQALLQRS